MTRAKAKYEIEAVDKTRAALRTIEKNVESIDKKFQAVGAAAATVMGARGFGATFKATVLDSARAIDEVTKASDRLGTNVETLQGFRFATELAGASAQDLELAWKTTGRNVSDAARGMGEGKIALEKLGISATDATGRIKTADQVMLEFADKLPKLSSEAEVTAAAMKLFGESGTKLLPMLRQGSEAMRDQIAEGRALSVVTRDLAAKGEDFKDANLRLDRSMKSMRDTVVGAVLPAFSKLAENAAKAIVEMRGLDFETLKSIESLALLGDQDFFSETERRAKGASDSIEFLRTETDRLRKSLKDSEGKAAQNPYAMMPDSVREARYQLDRFTKELARQEKIQERLGLLVDERNENVEKAQESDSALLAVLQAQSKESGILARTERAILADKLLQVEAYDDIEGRTKDALGYLKEQFAYVEDLPVPELDWSQFTMDFDTTLVEFEQMWDSASQRAADSMAGNIGAGLADVAIRGRTSAHFFKRAWKEAVDAVVSELGRLFVKKKLFPLLANIPILSWLDQTANVTALPGVIGAGAGGGNTFILNQQTLAPATTADFVRANRTFRDAQREASRFAVGR